LNKEQLEKKYGMGPRLPQDHPAVNYIDISTTEGQFCGNCLFFLGMRDEGWGWCSIVEDEIDNQAFCDLWTEIVPVTLDEDGLMLKSQPDASDTHVDAIVQTGDHGRRRKKRGKKKDKTYKSLFVPFSKADDEKRLVYGVVLEPEVVDAQGDIESEEEIEKAAHAFMIKSQEIQRQHNDEETSVKVVESFIAKEDFSLDGEPVKKGSWVMAVWVPDDEIWKAVKSGELTGFSIRGMGEREPEAA
jgi:hypothetical protein